MVRGSTSGPAMGCSLGLCNTKANYFSQESVFPISETHAIPDNKSHHELYLHASLQSPQILLLRSRCNRHSLGLGLQSLLGDQSCFGEGLQAGLGLQSCFGDGLQFWLDFHSCFGDGLHLSLFQLSFLPQSCKANPIRSDISYLAISSLFPMRS